ncbi:MAG: hypothetical protein AB8B73_13340, partial [Ekhidna sp.]
MKYSIYLNIIEIPEFRSRYIRNDDCLFEFFDSWIEFLSYFINTKPHSCECRNLTYGYAMINEIPVFRIASQNFNRNDDCLLFSVRHSCACRNLSYLKGG